MSIPVSVCGIVAKQDWEPYAWETRFDHTELAEPDPAVAYGFIDLDVRNEGIANGNALCHFLAAHIHPGHIERDTDHRLCFADLEVVPSYELEHHTEEQIWTVCGVRLGTGEPYSAPWYAYGPAMAFLAAWEAVRDDGDNLLLANVHFGDVNGDAEAVNKPLCDALAIRYADLSCKTGLEMRSVMREWAPMPDTARETF